VGSKLLFQKKKTHAIDTEQNLACYGLSTIIKAYQSYGLE